MGLLATSLDRVIPSLRTRGVVAGSATAIVAAALLGPGTAGAQSPAVAREAMTLYGIDYGQYRTGQSPDLGRHPTRAQIAQDLRYLRGLTDRIRIYGLSRSGRVAVEEASRLGFRVLVGVWLSDDLVSNEREIAAAIDLASSGTPGIEAFVVGSEVLLRQELDTDTIVSILRRVRAETGHPVAYAEVAAIWSRGGPEIDRLAAAADMILAHVYPFWDSIGIEQAPAHYERALADVRTRFPGKIVAVGETGWPVAGPANGDAVPSPENQATWLRYALTRSHPDRIYYFSAFSEEWKHEGGVGSHWGLLTAAGELRDEVAVVLAERGAEPGGMERAAGTPDSGDTPEALWDVYNRQAHEEVDIVAELIIARDSADARIQEEAGRRGPQLDAVGLAYFLRGCSREERADPVGARADFEVALTRFTHAEAWDPRGWWWSIAKAARERLQALGD